MNDDELITRLRAALTAPPVAPDQRALEGLNAALAALDDEPGASTPRAGTISSLRRMAGRRVSTLSVILVMSLVTSGVAAAAVATDTLPGPTRNIAWDLGLPVTSPALVQARQAASGLEHALHSRDRRHAAVLGHALIRDLKDLDAGDLSQVQGTADQLLEQAGIAPPTEITGTLGGDSTSPPASGADQSGDSTTTTTLPTDTTVPGLGDSLNLGGSPGAGDSLGLIGN